MKKKFKKRAKKTYFISIDFWNDHLNKFIYATRAANLKKYTVTEVAKQMIEEDFPGIDIKSLTIKINAFNELP